MVDREIDGLSKEGKATTPPDGQPGTDEGFAVAPTSETPVLVKLAPSGLDSGGGAELCVCVCFFQGSIRYL